MARGRHHNGQYTRGNGSPGDGTGFEFGKVSSCEQPEHLLGDSVQSPKGIAEDDVDPHHEQPYADNHDTPCYPLTRNSPPMSLRRSK